MSQPIDSASLADLVARLVEAARRAGADAADAVAVRSRSTGVSVRLGKTENTGSAESDDVSLRVFVGRRAASVSANAASDVAALAERAAAIQAAHFKANRKTLTVQTFQPSSNDGQGRGTN